MKSLVKVLQDARDDAGGWRAMTYQQLADHCGVSKATAYKWLDNPGKMKVSQLVTVCEVLEITVYVKGRDGKFYALGRD